METLDNIDSASDQSSTVSSEAECPICGLIYGADEDNSFWVCCGNYLVWFDLKCTTIEELPDHYYCLDCK